MAGRAVSFVWRESFGGLSLRFIVKRGKYSTALCHILSHPLIIPSLVELIVPMHRSRGTLPVCGGRPPRRGRGAASAKGLASSGLPATPEAFRLTEAFRAGVRHSLRFAAAAAAPADDGDDEDRGGS